MADDFYQTLGVKRDAPQEEIRKAYRKLARENHPDRKQGDEAAAKRFKEVGEAYSVLSDPEKRKQYDRFGKDFKHAGGFPGGGAGGFPGGRQVDLGDLFGEGFDLGDLFGGLGGGGRGGRYGGGPQGRPGGRSARPRRGGDVRTEVAVPLDTVATGGEVELTLDRDGKTERLTVKVPAGVNDGGTLRLARQGQPGFGGGEAGDLLVTVRVAAHPYYRRDGADLLVDVPVTPAEAALGARVDVPTPAVKDEPGGPVTLTLPAGIGGGRKLRLRGRGLPDRAGGRGDLYAVVKIVVPAALSDEQRGLYERLRESDPDVRDGLW